MRLMPASLVDCAVRPEAHQYSCTTLGSASQHATIGQQGEGLAHISAAEIDLGFAAIIEGCVGHATVLEN